MNRTCGFAGNTNCMSAIPLAYTSECRRMSSWKSLFTRGVPSSLSHTEESVKIGLCLWVNEQLNEWVLIFEKCKHTLINWLVHESCRLKAPNLHCAWCFPVVQLLTMAILTMPLTIGLTALRSKWGSWCSFPVPGGFEVEKYKLEHIKYVGSDTNIIQVMSDTSNWTFNSRFTKIGVSENTL